LNKKIRFIGKIMKMIRILIVDDHVVLRSGLRMVIDAQPDMDVVGEADNGSQVLILVESVQSDLILLDLSMPGLGGLETLPILRKIAPKSRILILTMHDDESYLRQALRDGASGYVLKRAADTELLSAIRAVMRGEVYVHPSLTRVLLDDILPETDAGASNPWDMLSEREREVLLRVARGFTSAKIAEQLNLSPKTVDTYRSRGMEKLGLRSRAALVQHALSHGLLSNNITSN
jgi:two-component system, NarL family, response regulator NreC